MKKLLITLAAVGVAAFVNAGAFQWKTGTLYAPGVDGTYNTSSKISSGITATLFSLTESEFNTIKSVLSTGYESQDMIDYVNDLQAGTFGTQIAAAKTTVGSISKNAVTITDTTGYTGTDASPLTVYEALLLKYTDSSDKEWYVVNYGSALYKADTDKALSKVAANFGGAEGSYGTITGWVSVPEPTSGLLLVLGMCGLALRRKRA